VVLNSVKIIRVSEGNYGKFKINPREAWDVRGLLRLMGRMPIIKIRPLTVKVNKRWVK
jgi:hypothetical protein